MSAGMDRRDEVLRRLLLEETDPLVAFAQSELAGDESARTELEELLGTRRRLEGLAAEERDALRPSPPGSAELQAEQRVLERLRAHVAAQAAPRRARKPRLNVVLLLAAVLALVLGWRWLAVREPEPGPDTPLGPGARLEILVPVGPVATFGEIAWSGERPDGAHFVVRVSDGTPAGNGAEVATSPPLEQNRWTPAEDAWKRWPTEIRLRVELHGSEPGAPLARSQEVRARLLP